MKLLNQLTRNPSDPKIIKSGTSSAGPADSLTRGLAWFGICLGAVELIAPRRISRALGVDSPGARMLIRAFGVREIAAGVLTLSTEKKIGLWARVGGDALDIAALTSALNTYNPQRKTVGAALVAVLGVTALDLLAAGQVTARSARKQPARNYSDRSGFPNGTGRTRFGSVQSPAREMQMGVPGSQRRH
ncbi:hypothetical protein [Hyphomicrobium sp.]|uniref:hypothetical protein n=1 Tax=Hyphomicrobium sp. TaxID=82 RepID=UPI002D789D9D|nr:hypothetical protein [Hyphomicrobium sp.]HET6389222.1 hypothetical protein [Hyphomicrobium sp.]